MTSSLQWVVNYADNFINIIVFDPTVLRGTVINMNKSQTRDQTEP